MIPFNRPPVVGTEIAYIQKAILEHCKLAGDGPFTKQCHDFFEQKYSIPKALLTTSCTSALEMAAILCDLKVGDEVIVPSFTFVSSANAFVLRGAKIVFADSYDDNPNIDPAEIERLITKRTKVIVVVHYAGVACDMDPIVKLAKLHGIAVVEDAAQGIDSYYKGRPLGTIGRFGTFSFHETKNVVCGEGGLLSVNDPNDISRAEIVREKGTNRSAFFRGEVDKYSWVDLGSSYLPSELNAAYLAAQLDSIELIQKRRKDIWNRYQKNLSLARLNSATLPIVPPFATVNGHMFYLVCTDIDQRTNLIAYLKNKGVHAVFHYLSLHSSSYFNEFHDGRSLPNSDRFSNSLVRLPLFYELTNEQVDEICTHVVNGLIS